MSAAPADHVLAGTGSRSLLTAPADVRRLAVDRVHAAVQERKARHADRLVVMSGMAEGFDELIAVTALRADVRLWCAVPNRGYGAHYWGRNSLIGRDRLAEFERILAAAWKATYVMEDVHGTTGLYLGGVHSNFVRNDFMVKWAAELVAWDSASKGAAHCVAAAKRAGKPCEVLSADAMLPVDVTEGAGRG